MRGRSGVYVADFLSHTHASLSKKILPTSANSTIPRVLLTVKWIFFKGMCTLTRVATVIVPVKRLEAYLAEAMLGRRVHDAT